MTASNEMSMANDDGLDVAIAAIRFIEDLFNAIDESGSDFISTDLICEMAIAREILENRHFTDEELENIRADDPTADDIDADTVIADFTPEMHQAIAYLDSITETHDADGVSLQQH